MLKRDVTFHDGLPRLTEIRLVNGADSPNPSSYVLHVKSKSNETGHFNQLVHILIDVAKDH